MTIISLGEGVLGDLVDDRESSSRATGTGLGDGTLGRFPLGRMTTPDFISSIDFTEWLTDQNATRCILVEVVVNVANVETTRYLSTVGYVTLPSDLPSNTFYEPRISGGLVFSERVDLNGSAGVQFGDIELSNIDGGLDTWLDDVWNNRAVTVYLGDIRWPRAEFNVIFNGIVSDIGSSSRDKLNIGVVDKIQRLNSSLSEAKLGGVSSKADSLIPLSFGEAVNVSPLLADEPTHEYQVHDGVIESIIEVRDNGVPVTVVDDLANGKFTLTAAPAGTITASVQGDKPVTYDNTVSTVIQNIVQNYGKSTEQFTSSDLDGTNLAAFDAANVQPIGYYSSGRENVISAIKNIASSVGASVLMSRIGEMRLLKIELPPSGTPIEIGVSDMKAQDITPIERVKVIAGSKIAYCKNWTIQNNLQTGIPEDHKVLFEEEWLTKTVSDAATATKYILNEDPEQEQTYLLVGTDATAEATRRLTLWKTQRTIFRFSGFANMLELELGDAVTITHPRYGLSGGKTGMIIGLNINWIDFTVSVEVII